MTGGEATPRRGMPVAVAVAVAADDNPQLRYRATRPRDAKVYR